MLNQGKHTIRSRCRSTASYCAMCNAGPFQAGHIFKCSECSHKHAAAQLCCITAYKPAHAACSSAVLQCTLARALFVTAFTTVGSCPPYSCDATQHCCRASRPASLCACSLQQCCSAPNTRSSLLWECIFTCGVFAPHSSDANQHCCTASQPTSLCMQPTAVLLCTSHWK